MGNERLPTADASKMRAELRIAESLGYERIVRGNVRPLARRQYPRELWN